MADAYDVAITRRDSFDGIGINTEWRVEAKRRSDGEILRRDYEFRWLARRFGRSPRRLAKAFERQARSITGVCERFTVHAGN